MGKNGDPSISKGNSDENRTKWDVRGVLDVLKGRGKNAAALDTGIGGLQELYDNSDSKGVESSSDPAQAQGGDSSLAHLVEETGKADKGSADTENNNPEKGAAEEKQFFDAANEDFMSAWGALHNAQLQLPDKDDPGFGAAEINCQNAEIEYYKVLGKIDRAMNGINGDEYENGGMHLTSMLPGDALLYMRRWADRVYSNDGKGLDAPRSNGDAQPGKPATTPSGGGEAMEATLSTENASEGSDENKANQKIQETATEVEAKPVVKKEKDPLSSRDVNQIIANAAAHVAADQAVYDAYLAEKSHKANNKNAKNSSANKAGEEESILSDDQLNAVSKKIDEFAANDWHTLKGSSEASAQEPAESENGESESSEEKIDANKAVAQVSATPISEAQPAGSKDSAESGNSKPNSEPKKPVLRKLASGYEKRQAALKSQESQPAAEDENRKPLSMNDVAEAVADYEAFKKKFLAEGTPSDKDKRALNELEQEMNAKVDAGYEDFMNKKYPEGDGRGELDGDSELPRLSGEEKISLKDATLDQLDRAIMLCDSKAITAKGDARRNANTPMRLAHLRDVYASREKLEGLRNWAAEKALEEARNSNGVFEALSPTAGGDVLEAMGRAATKAYREAEMREAERDGFKMLKNPDWQPDNLDSKKIPDMSDSSTVAKINKIIFGDEDKKLDDLSQEGILELIKSAKGDFDAAAKEGDFAAKLDADRRAALLGMYGKDRWGEEAPSESESEGEPAPEGGEGDETEVLPLADQPSDAPMEEEKQTKPEEKKIYSDDEISAIEKYAQATADEAAEKLVKGSGYFGGHDRGEDFGKLQAKALAAFGELAKARGSRLEQDNPNATPEELAARRSELSQADVWARNQVYGIFEQHMDGDKGPEKLSRLTKVWRKIGKMNSNINGTIDDHIHNKWGRIAARGIVYGVAGVAATTAVGMLGLTGVGGAVAGTGAAAALAAVRLKQGARGTVYTKDKDGNKVWRNLTPEAVERMAKEKRLKFAISVGAAALGAFAKVGISELLNHHAGAMAGGGNSDKTMGGLDQNTSGSRAQLNVDGGNVSPTPDVSNLVNIPGAGNLSPQDATNLVLRTVQGQYGDGEARRQALGASYDWVQGMVDKVAAAHGGNVLNVQPQDITPESLGLESAA